jgi:hypothetical protein
MAMATTTTVRSSSTRALGAWSGMTAKRRTSLWIVLGTFATVLSVAAAASIQMRKDHAIALEQVERESRSFVAVTGALVTGALDRTQEMLRRSARISAGAAIATDPALINVVATDALGNVAWDKNGTPIEPRRLSDMALLRKLAATPDSVRFVSGTFADNEFGKSPFVVAMRSDNIAGQFVFALIDPLYLTSLLESVQGSRSVGVILADAQTRRIASTAPIDDALYARFGHPANVSNSTFAALHRR